MSTSNSQILTIEEARELHAFVNTTERTDAQILRRIESLDVSADVKALLSDLLRLATQVGEAVLRVGRKILDFVLTMIRQFPALSFAVVIAAVLTLLVSMVPLLGGILASLLGPLLMALGVAGGAALEIQSGDFRERVAQFAAGFQPMAA